MSSRVRVCVSVRVECFFFGKNKKFARKSIMKIYTNDGQSHIFAICKFYDLEFPKIVFMVLSCLINEIYIFISLITFNGEIRMKWDIETGG